MRGRIRRPFAVIVIGLLLSHTISCKLFQEPTRKSLSPPPISIAATRIEYVDTDGFDALLETALSNNDPVILIETKVARPEWRGRLNAWLAAWNMGGKVEAVTENRKIRLQAPLIPSITVDKDSIREFRYLVEGFMQRVDDLAQRSSTWWLEERTRRRRVELLKPYNLRFHQDEEGLIQIIFFNGKYSEQYPDFVKNIVRRGQADDSSWERNISCSQCDRGTLAKSDH